MTNTTTYQKRQALIHELDTLLLLCQELTLAKHKASSHQIREDFIKVCELKDKLHKKCDDFLNKWDGRKTA